MTDCKSEQASQGPLDIVLLLAIVLLAGAWAGYNAWKEQHSPNQVLDLDGWGHVIPRLKDSGGSFATLFTEPSLWKGPVVPFVFGLCYYLAPVDASVLLMNAGLFALSTGVLFDAFRRLGAGRWIAVGALLLWVFYLPHAMIFGYYFAEPLLALLSAIVFWLAARIMARASIGTVFALGVACGALVLARAPFVLVVLGLPLILWRPLAGMRFRALALYGVGFLVAFAPWPIRNLLVEREFIPFTTEGGKVLFQGTYLPGDDIGMRELRALPSFQEIEAHEEGMSAVEQYHYWRELALTQIKAAPLAQARLVVRKAIRFWMYLPAHSWVPGWKTAVAALLALPLAAIGSWKGRHRPLIQLCVLWVGSLWSFHTLIHSELRYNFLVLPMLFLLAGMGLQYVISRANAAQHCPGKRSWSARTGHVGDAAASDSRRLIAP
jgi:hypothetical protein